MTPPVGAAQPDHRRHVLSHWLDREMGTWHEPGSRDVPGGRYSASSLRANRPGAVVTFRVNVAGTQPGAAPSRDQVGTKLGLSQDQVILLRLCRTESTLLELMSAVGRKSRTKFRIQFIQPLLDLGLIQMTIPDKPNSRLQKYRITPAGIEAMQ